MGYSDEPTRLYRYDNRVANHKQLDVGHLVILRDDRSVLGAARIAGISSRPELKIVRKCPSCGGNRLRERKHASPKWICSTCSVTFDAPVEQKIDVVGYEAEYGASYVSAPEGIAKTILRAASPRPNDQLAIQELAIPLLRELLLPHFPGLQTLIDGDEPVLYLSPESADESIESPTGTDGYVPGPLGARETVMRAIKLRRGQKAFRNMLIERYDGKCMLSGCDLLDVLEAAHISPYRDPSDNAEGNGLLLRADLHTLFDPGLLHFNPATLEAVFSKSAQNSGYAELHGKLLRRAKGVRPSEAALRTRWDNRQASLRSL